MVLKKCAIVSGILGAVLAVALTYASAGEKEELGNGFTQPMLTLSSTGVFEYQGVQVQFFLASMKSPHVDKAGSAIIVLSPVDLVRDAEGRPVVVVSDPTRGGALSLSDSDGRKFPAKPIDVARAVQSGQLPPETLVSVTIELRLDHSEALKKAVFEAARSQLTRQVEKSDAALAPLSSGDWERLRNSVVWPTVREFRVTAAGEGLKEMAFVVSKNPTLRERMRMTAKVPALFVSKLYSEEGVELQAEYNISVFQAEGAWGTVMKTADDVLDIMIKESSLGHLKLDDKSGLVEILGTREQAQEMLRSPKWKESIGVIGSDSDSINTVLQLLQRMDVDVFKVTEDQFESWMKQHELTLETLRKPGVAETLQSLSQKDQFSDQEVEKFESMVKALQKSAQGGGGISLFGVVSLGGGGGNSEASLEAAKKQNRQALQQFVKDLNVYQKNGKFPVPPTGRYSMISKQAIRRAVEQHAFIHKGGAVKTITFSTLFSSVHPTLEQQRSLAISPGEDKARQREQALRDTQRALDQAERVLTQAKKSADAAETRFRDQKASWDAQTKELASALADVNAKSAAFDEKKLQHHAAINKPRSAYHGNSATAKMAWDAHCFKEFKAASEALTSAVAAYQAVSNRHCGVDQGELTAALAAFREKLVRHDAALAKPPQAYHGQNADDKFAWDLFTWQGNDKEPGLKSASEALVSAVSSFRVATDRAHDAKLAGAKATLDSAQRAVAEAEREVDRRREALEKLQQ